ncbi:MAG TPA: hypothetical protein DCL38_10060 [Lachnospiraceae bacterium]|nr:hypothetical protein [Lachnospiraceae bacterium]
MELKEILRDRVHTMLRKKTWLPLLIAASAAVVYILAVRKLGFGIPCLFHRVTGFKCPGCGVTGMLTALSRLDFKTAFSSNPFLFITLPFPAFELIFMWSRSVNKRKSPSWNEGLLIFYLILLISWGIVRNIICVN